MRIEIDRGSPAVDLESLERRLRSGFAPLAEGIASIRLALSDVNGPRGGRDKRAEILLRLRRGGEVRASRLSRSLARAIGGSVAKLRRGLVRRLERRRDRPRRRVAH